jgi:hypothetical protein
MAKVLICGVYFADRKNCMAAEVAEFAASRHHQVEQRWVALDFGAGVACKHPGTVEVVTKPMPKFTIINRLLKDVENFDFLIIADDDVDLPRGFVVNFLALVERYQFALSQPARTSDSYIDHFITTSMPGIDARLTRFVEIGPIFCIHRTAFGVLLPFDLSSPMGWGYDFIWPIVIERNRLRMGIIDATPIGHKLRKPLTNYDKTTVKDQMAAILEKYPHLSKADSYVVLEAYA